VPMRLLNDSTLETDVQWYWADEDAPSLPYDSPFYSQQYDIGQYPEQSLGERYLGRTWVNGSKPFALGTGGLCGNKEAWNLGKSALDPVPVYYPGSKVPTCCSPPPAIAIGGVGYGGSGFDGVVPCDLFGWTDFFPATLQMDCDIDPPQFFDGTVCSRVGIDRFWVANYPGVIGGWYWYFSLICGGIPDTVFANWYSSAGGPGIVFLSSAAPSDVDASARKIFFDVPANPGGGGFGPIPAFRLTVSW